MIPGFARSASLRELAIRLFSGEQVGMRVLGALFSTRTGHDRDGEQEKTK